MFKEVQVEHRSPLLVFLPQTQIEPGLSVIGSEVFALPDAASDGEVGALLRSAFARAEAHGEYPSIAILQERLAKRWNLVGVKSEAAYKKLARMVDIVEDHERDVVEFTPTHNEGARKGYQHLVNQRLICPRNTEDSELGRCLRAAFESSK